MTPDQLAAISKRYEHLSAYLDRWDGADYKLTPDDVHAVDDIPILLAEVDRLTEHSKTLNSVAFAIAEALGDVPPGADRTEGNPVEQAEKLIRQRESLGRRCSARFAEREEARAEAQQARDERDRALRVIRQAYEAGDDAWRICANALHPTDPTKLAEAEPPTGWRDETTGLISGGLITD